MYLLSGATEALSLNYSLVVVVCLFVLFHLFMRGVFYKPLFRTLAAREAATEGKLKAAAGDRGRRGELVAKLDQSLRQARTEAGAVLERVRAEINREQAERLSALQEELQGAVGRARDEVALQVEKSRERLGEDIAGFARLAAERILARELKS